MRGEVIGVWSEMWREVWSKLAKHPNAPDDLFCELFRELNTARNARLDPATTLADIVDNPAQARAAFRKTKASDLQGEVAVVGFLERAHHVIEDFGCGDLTNRYFVLAQAFLEKYSLRYDLRRPFSLHPTLPGVFARLMRDLRSVTSQDAALSALMREFEETVRDLKGEQSPRRVKQCIAAQFNLLEGLLKAHPAVIEFNATRENEHQKVKTFGAMCDQAKVWPHHQMKEAAKNIFGFASDYPGIRHAGTPAHSLREIDMRDMIAVSVALTGMATYLSQTLNAEAIYSD
ncbi:hypothetical protein SAMN05421774_11910 [Gemmobacter megaterium]|uniref:Uncharacterized protein n=1 Tax=Gemmobacter megaterium TaxID=1086013 RepID=A0A1N7QQ13_9RHOB|nr:hypothetical protein [Gemmobacter megaterium]GGE28496.1 hypothetical protein GCM10011345_38200 [Gemmobacter megaterium]SIT24886.1 hypothetical protein SAMN05421774_11910 [Gemmobacter megaterium]